MERAFGELRQAICQPGATADVAPAVIEEFASQAVVALAVGGHGSRLGAMTDAQGINKSAMRLPNGNTMVELTIRMYREAGFQQFVALVAHQAHSIVDVLGDGSNLGVRVSYSYDPGGEPVGRGGAIRNALDNGTIPRSHSLIVHNPDDIIINYAGSFPHDLVASHLGGVERGMVATAVMAAGLPATFTGMSVQDGVVEEVMPYPAIPVPAHVGVTVFSPAVYGLFDDLFGGTKRSDFEPVLFPALVKDRLLYSCFIPATSWIQVNDPKAWKTLVATLEAQEVLRAP
jgi:NDP-sugar pyrophosphorylase family protein